MGTAMPFASLSPAADHRPSSLLPFCRAAPLSAAGEDAAQQQQHAMSGRWAARPALFTAAQYEELEHQALIYKYLVAGVPVPPDLLLPLRRGFVYHQPLALGYGPYFGKKVDPEPGRCRRTDGKKWRCSKEAAPDSKYCERHMHRGRNRSRKPVEAQLAPPPHAQPQPQQQQQQAPAPAAVGFQNHPLYPSILTGNGGGGVGGGGGSGGTFGLGPTSQLHMDSAAAYATAAGGGSKDLRYSAYGVKSLSDDSSPLLSGGMDPSMDNSWRLLPSQTNTFQATSYPVFGTLSGLDESTIASLPKTQREPLSFFGSDFVAAAKQENQTLRPFFDEWPRSRDSWPELGEDSSLGFSATQLSISIPMATSDFSNTSSRSPSGIPSR